jgi:ATP-dependent DNA helicase DinG
MRARRCCTCLPIFPTPATRALWSRPRNGFGNLLEITRGRAFCLFTSYALMNQLYERLLGELNFPMLLQGSAPKNALLEEFRLTPNAVLFAPRRSGKAWMCRASN